MSDFLSVNVVIVASLFLFTYLGVRRGGIAEGIAAAGLVLSGALMIVVPSDAIATFFGASPRLVGICVACLCLSAGMMASWAAIRIVRPPALGRGCVRVGAVCGLLNGIWIQTFILEEWQRHGRTVDSEGSIIGSPITQILVDHVEIALFALSACVLAVSGALAVSAAWSRLNNMPRDRSAWRHRGFAFSGATALRLPTRADGGKVDPLYDPKTGLAQSVPCTTFIRSRPSSSRWEPGWRTAWRDSSTWMHGEGANTWYRIGPRRADETGGNSEGPQIGPTQQS